MKKKHLNKEFENKDNMVSEEFISLTFLALASLGVIVAVPFFVEGAVIIMAVIIVAWKKFYEKVLKKIGLHYISTSLIICGVSIGGLMAIFKGELSFVILGSIYILSSLIGFKLHLENIYENTIGVRNYTSSR